MSAYPWITLDFLKYYSSKTARCKHRALCLWWMNSQLTKLCFLNQTKGVVGMETLIFIKTMFILEDLSRFLRGLKLSLLLLLEPNNYWAIHYLHQAVYRPVVWLRINNQPLKFETHSNSFKLLFQTSFLAYLTPRLRMVLWASALTISTKRIKGPCTPLGILRCSFSP